MRFMMFIKVGSDDFEPTADDAAAMMKYNEELQKAGALLALDGLQPPSAGATITFGADGRATVVDGPFAEAKEVIGGYWIIQAKTKEEAVEWAKRVPAYPGQTIELRQIFDVADYSPEVQEVAQASEVASSPPPEQTQSSL
jgi:hypothetical protein